MIPWTVEKIEFTESRAEDERWEHMFHAGRAARALADAARYTEDSRHMARRIAEHRGDGWTEWDVLREAVGA